MASTDYKEDIEALRVRILTLGRSILNMTAQAFADVEMLDIEYEQKVKNDAKNRAHANQSTRDAAAKNTGKNRGTTQPKPKKAVGKRSATKPHPSGHPAAVVGSTAPERPAPSKDKIPKPKKSKGKKTMHEGEGGPAPLYKAQFGEPTKILEIDPPQAATHGGGAFPNGPPLDVPIANQIHAAYARALRSTEMPESSAPLYDRVGEEVLASVLDTTGEAKVEVRPLTLNAISEVVTEASKDLGAVVQGTQYYDVLYIYNNKGGKSTLLTSISDDEDDDWGNSPARDMTHPNVYTRSLFCTTKRECAPTATLSPSGDSVDAATAEPAPFSHFFPINPSASVGSFDEDGSMRGQVVNVTNQIGSVDSMGHISPTSSVRSRFERLDSWRRHRAEDVAYTVAQHRRSSLIGALPASTFFYASCPSNTVSPMKKPVTPSHPTTTTQEGEAPPPAPAHRTSLFTSINANNKPTATATASSDMRSSKNPTPSSDAIPSVQTPKSTMRPLYNVLLTNKTPANKTPREGHQAGSGTTPATSTASPVNAYGTPVRGMNANFLEAAAEETEEDVALLAQNLQVIIASGYAHLPGRSESNAVPICVPLSSEPIRISL